MHEIMMGLQIQPEFGFHELRVLQRRAHTLVAFLDLGLGQSDEIECRQAVGEMHFDANKRCLHPAKRTGKDDGDTHRGMMARDRSLDRVGSRNDEIQGRHRALHAWRRRNTLPS